MSLESMRHRVEALRRKLAEGADRRGADRDVAAIRLWLEPGAHDDPEGLRARLMELDDGPDSIAATLLSEEEPADG